MLYPSAQTLLPNSFKILPTDIQRVVSITQSHSKGKHSDKKNLHIELNS